MSDYQLMITIVDRGFRPKRPARPLMEDKLWSLVTQCWQAEPKARKTAEEAGLMLMPLVWKGE